MRKIHNKKENHRVKYAACVTLYNPDMGVVDNIKTYANGVERIYVIDNSEEQQCDVENDIKQIENVQYYKMNGNKGVSFALNLALKCAIKDGYDYLLTMDQDTRFYPGQINRFIDKINQYIVSGNYKRVGIFAADTSSQDNKHNKNDELVSLVLTSGNFINTKIINDIGGFDDRLFIDWIDQDICYRLKKVGYKIILFREIGIKHNLGERQKVKMGCVCFEITVHNVVRYYYMTRNKFYVLKKNHISIIKKTRFYLGTIASIVRIIAFEKDKVSKVSAIVYGYIDYLHDNIEGKP